MNERSLVYFTLLSQAACGALVGLAGVQALGSTDVLGPLSFIAVGLLLLVAAMTSTLHLGAPRHAPYALLNWRNSWLSREIVMLGVTGGLVALGATIGLVSTPEASHVTRTAIGFLAAAAGVVLVLTMIRLYSVRTIPEWSPPTTAARFAGTSLRLGGIVAGVLVAIATWPEAPGAAPALWIAFMLAMGLGLGVVLHRQRGSKPVRHGANPGALLARGVPLPDDNAFLARLALGAGLAVLGVVALIAMLPQVALLLLAVGGVITTSAELGLRERFYALAPLQGRVAARTRRLSRPDPAGR